MINYALCLLWLAVIVKASEQKREPDLRLLCARKPIVLTRGSQLRALVEQLDRDDLGVDCPSKRARLELIELDRLINGRDNVTDICSLERVARIRDYRGKYISARPGNQKPIWALKRLFIGYGLRVSNLCKKNMINSLQSASRRLLSPLDFEQMRPWIGEHSPLGQILNEPSDYDDLLLPRDLNGFEKDDQTDDGPVPDSEKLLIQTATGHTIAKVQALCERRFKPLYEQLIMPIVSLSNMGFNYLGEELERELQELSLNKEVHQWYRLVFLCESLAGLQVVEGLEDVNKTLGSDLKLVRILTEEEAAKLKARGLLREMNDTEVDQIQRVSFQADSGGRLEDKLVDLEDRQFMRMLNSFDARKSELDRIGTRLIKRLAGRLMRMLKEARFSFVGTLMSSAQTKQQDSWQNFNYELVGMFDNYISQLKYHDEPVSGLTERVGGVARRYYHQVSYDGASNIALRVRKNTIDKANVSRYFWYAMAVAIFLVGLGLMIGLGK